MKAQALAMLAGIALMVPARVIGKALDFGGFAWLATFVVILLLAGLVDREYFYGSREPE
jgi:hypothetical protein